MLNALLNSLASLGLLGWLWMLWRLWGAAARRAGVGRLQLLGMAALLGWLL